MLLQDLVQRLLEGTSRAARGSVELEVLDVLLESQAPRATMTSVEGAARRELLLVKGVPMSNALRVEGAVRREMLSRHRLEARGRRALGAAASRSKRATRNELEPLDGRRYAEAAV